MKLTKEDKIKYWREHIEQASKHKEGLFSYCHEQKISKSAMYRWKKYFSDLQISKPIEKKKFNKSQKQQSPFLPVIVETSDLQNSSQFKKNTLPDPSWLAEVIVKVIQGLS